MGIENPRVEFMIDRVRAFDEQRGVVPARQGFIHRANWRHRDTLHETQDRGLFFRLGLAQRPVDHLTGHITVSFRAFPHDLFGDIDIRRPMRDDDLGMFQGIFDFRQGGDSFADQAFGLPRRKSEYSAHGQIPHLVDCC